ncbi:MAG: hypothetical protein Q7V31_06540 [Parvibaculum sp.]|uniref:hypothetical protein n=1 Tax=Parvibaculum sp. TaxID=2024848 RepID=UPI002716FCCA|nr:hypothetical protein [Parvibaculum sp.]MDO8838571.1 hypothetical protein [Parvibaculum sp.]
MFASHPRRPARASRDGGKYLVELVGFGAQSCCPRSFETLAPNPLGCINVDGPRSPDQLAQQIVRADDWNPQLMDGTGPWHPPVWLAGGLLELLPLCRGRHTWRSRFES